MLIMRKITKFHKPVDFTTQLSTRDFQSQSRRLYKNSVLCSYGPTRSRSDSRITCIFCTQIRALQLTNSNYLTNLFKKKPRYQPKHERVSDIDEIQAIKDEIAASQLVPSDDNESQNPKMLIPRDPNIADPELQEYYINKREVSAEGIKFYPADGEMLEKYGATMRGPDEVDEQYNLIMNKKGHSIEDPLLVGSSSDRVIVGCVCDEFTSLKVMWFYLEAGPVMQCNCGTYFKLEITDYPNKYGETMALSKEDQVIMDGRVGPKLRKKFLASVREEKKEKSKQDIMMMISDEDRVKYRELYTEAELELIGEPTPENLLLIEEEIKRDKELLLKGKDEEDL